MTFISYRCSEGYREAAEKHRALPTAACGPQEGIRGQTPISVDKGPTVYLIMCGHLVRRQVRMFLISIKK